MIICKEQARAAGRHMDEGRAISYRIGPSHGAIQRFSESRAIKNGF